MRTRLESRPATSLTLDPTATTPLHRQIYAGLREAILTGRLAAGAPLPSSRTYAGDLAVSRTTVVTAFEQLLAEGFLISRTGAGTFVAPALPGDLMRPATGAPYPSAVERPVRRELSRRGEVLATTPIAAARDEGQPRAFRPGIPALDAFPFALWARLVARRYRRPPASLLSYGDPAGYRPLREAIAGYLSESRGVRCRPEQVLVVTGTQQAIDLTARVLLDPGDAVWVEDPGYIAGRGALRGAGAAVVPVPVDGQGIDVVAGVATAPAARMAYVTPSHQYPLGVTMSLSRRLALLEWASQAGAWVLEDDYDSEYRYAGRPLAALQGLDGDGRVVYLGTFSKVMFPSLCLAYLVVPADLVDAFVAARVLVNRHAPSLEQAALTDFIVEGHFTRHIRRMRGLYAARQAALVAAVRRELAGLVTVAPAEAGLHLVGWLAGDADDRSASVAAARHGVEAPPLSPFSLLPPPRPGLLLGFAAVNDAEIDAAARRLATALAPTG
ncbi:MAG: PLP-dependent aminotransferase family protein [Chloroflexi bacterium]|nr:PLP-dependent aminotransferase family protein [Chloroflexota bacterium]